MLKLFRDEALVHSRRRILGDVIIATSLRSRVISLLLTGIVFGALAFASLSSYSRREAVSGWLVPESGMVRLTARQGGVVSLLHVREGEIVQSGQPIATIKLSSSVSRGDSYASLAKNIEAQRIAAATQNEANLAILVSEKKQLDLRLAILRQEQDELKRRGALQAQRLEFAKAEVSRAEMIVAQGFLPRRELEARRANAIAIEQESSQLVSQALTLEREVLEIQARLNEIPINLNAARAEALSSRAILERSATETEASMVQVVTAPVSGSISALPAILGQSLSPGASIAVITDASSPLQAELYAPSRASGFLREGQEVRLQYQAYPHQKFGTGKGILTSISYTTLSPSEVPSLGLPQNEPVLRLKVAIDRDFITAYGQKINLKPGMLLTADVIIDQRTLLEWLLDPLYATGRRK